MKYKDLPNICLNGDRIEEKASRSWCRWGLSKKSRKGGLQKQGSISCEVLNCLVEDGLDSEDMVQDEASSSVAPLRPAPAAPSVASADDDVIFRPAARTSQVRSVDHECAEREGSGGWNVSFRNLRDQQRAGIPSQIYEAIYDYKTDRMDELGLTKGETVKVITTETGEVGWFYAETCHGKKGLIPATFVELIGREPRHIPAQDISLPYTSLDASIIGHGGFAIIYKVNYKLHEVVALKKLKTVNRSDPSKYIEALKHEALMINRFDHPNIVGLYGVCLEEPYMGIVLEFCAGKSLKDVLRKLSDSFISVRTMVDWALQIAHAMQYLAEKNCVHRDLKADNVLVKEEVCLCCLEGVNNSTYLSESADICSVCRKRPLDKLTLKLTDFGVTKELVPHDNRQSVKTVGTNAFLAPEAYMNHQYSQFSDVWSYGVLLWEILTKKEPYGSVCNYLIAFKVGRNGSTLEVDEDCPLLWKDLMRSCWEMTASARPTFKQLCEKFNDYAEQLKADTVTRQEEQRVHEAQQKLYSFVNNPDKDKKSQEDEYLKLCHMMNDIMDRKQATCDLPEKKPLRRPKRITKEDIGRPDTNDVRHFFSLKPSDNASSSSTGSNFVILRSGKAHPVQLNDLVLPEHLGTLPRSGRDDHLLAGTLPRRDKMASAAHPSLHNALSISSPNLHQIKLDADESRPAEIRGTLRRKDAIKRKKNSIVSPTSCDDEPVVELADAASICAGTDIHEPVKTSPAGKEKSHGRRLPNIFSKSHQTGIKSGGRQRSGEKNGASTPSSARSSTTSSSSILPFGNMTRNPMPHFIESPRSRASSAASRRTSEDVNGSPVSARAHVNNNKSSPRLGNILVQETSHTNRYYRTHANPTPMEHGHFTAGNHRTISMDDTIPSPSESGGDMFMNDGCPIPTHSRTPSDDRAGMHLYETLSAPTLSPPSQRAPVHSPIEPTLSTVVPLPTRTTHFSCSSNSSPTDDPYIMCGPIPPGVERDRTISTSYIQLPRVPNPNGHTSHSTTVTNDQYFHRTPPQRRPDTLPLHNAITPESGISTGGSSAFSNMSLLDQVPLTQAPPPPRPRPPAIPPRDGSVGLPVHSAS